MVETTYERAKEVKAQCERDHNIAVATLMDVSGIEKGQFGLTPDRIKSTPEWKAAFRAERVAFSQLRSINGFMSKNFKKEMAAERKERRASQ